MKIVIAGGGNVGTFIATDLADAGHDVTIVEVDPARTETALEVGETPGVRWVVADACEVSEFDKAEVAQADVVAAVTGDDEDNLVISLLAKQEFAVPRVVARVNNPRNEWMFTQAWGVDVSVSTPHLLTALVEEAVSVGTLVRLLSFEGGRARLSEATLTDASPSVGLDLAELALPRDSTVVAILRDSHVIVPRGDSVLRSGDEVLVLTTPEAEDEVVSVLLGSDTGESATPTPPVDIEG
ncbi:TrkA family potassium uptake protein [Iamia sp.]|uniref:potassium channel family protein n=1 Tax=Iamia sp. TaxID=2722710 RepID=UPI002B57D4E2|nr:TrkA family potassium uptake protein [Iamia sp.]HXH57756.1 TrkA family potassium uptake protein [Iamia sp.]